MPVISGIFALTFGVLIGFAEVLCYAVVIVWRIAEFLLTESKT